MMGSGPGNNDFMMDFMVALALIVMVLLFIVILYKQNAGPINHALIEFNRYQLYALAHLPGEVGDESAYSYYKLAEKNPLDYTWSEIVGVFEYVGRKIRWFTIPILAGFVAWGFVSKHKVSDFYRRVFDMQQLVALNVKEYPWMAPIANRKKSILEEPYDTGPWRTPRTATQFVAENKLLLTKKGRPVAKRHLLDKHGLENLRSKIIVDDNNKDLSVDKEKAKELFMKQVGPKFNGVDTLPDHLKGLVAALMAIGAGDKDKGFELLDHMSLTFVEAEKEGGPFEISIKGADKLIKKYKDNETLAYYTNHHTAYLYPYLMALLQDHARAKHGVLPTDRFIWLRPVDPQLYSILNQMGGREPFIEGAGAWTHYEAENMAKQSLPEPEVDNAVKGLEDKLIKLAWLPIPKGWQDG